MEITDILVKADYEVTVYPTQSRGDAKRLMRERDKCYELVVCSGGDGTLDEIVTGMVQSGFKTTIGYIPAGSTNDFAKSLKIPSTMKKAAEIVAQGNVFSCDIGRFNKDIFVYVLGMELEDTLYRLKELKKYNFTPFMQPYRDLYSFSKIDPELKKMSRWCNRKWLFKSCSYEEYNDSIKKYPLKYEDTIKFDILDFLTPKEQKILELHIVEKKVHFQWSYTKSAYNN